MTVFKFRYRVIRLPLVPEIQYEWLGINQIIELMRDVTDRNDLNIMGIYKNPISTSTMIKTIKSYACLQMTRFKNKDVMEASPTTVYHLWKLMSTTLSEVEREIIPSQIGYVNFTDQMNYGYVSRDAVKLGVKIGAIQIMEIDPGWEKYYKMGYYPFIENLTFVISDTDRRFTLQGDYGTFNESEEQINYIIKENFYFRYYWIVDDEGKNPYERAVYEYRTNMSYNELDELAETVGMFIPNHIDTEKSRHDYFRKNIRFYENLVYEKIKRISSRVPFEKYPDKYIFDALGLVFTYDSRPELVSKARKLFSKDKKDMFIVSFTSKKLLERFALFHADIYEREDFTSYIVNDRDFLSLYFGNYYFKFFGFILVNYLSSVGADLGNRFYYSEWKAYSNQEGAPLILDYVDEVLNLAEDIGDLTKDEIDIYKNIRSTKNINTIKAINEIRFEEYRMSIISKLGPKLTEENRKLLKDVAMYALETGMYSRQWLGPPHTYPGMKVERVESDAITWHTVVMENGGLQGQDLEFLKFAIDRMEEMRKGDSIGSDDSEFNFFILARISETKDRINALPDGIDEIFRLRMIRDSSLDYTEEEKEADFLQFLDMILAKTSQYNGCIRSASKKILVYAGYIINGLLDEIIPGFSIDQLSNIF